MDKLFILYKFQEEGESNPGFPGESLTWARLSGSGEFYTGKKSSILQQKSLTDCKAKFKIVLKAD